MTQISRDEVLQLAQLSSLQLTDSEINMMQKDLGNILGYVIQLSKVDTENVEPTYQVTGLSNVWRDDTVINYGVTREELLARAPKEVDFQIKVPKVL